MFGVLEWHGTYFKTKIMKIWILFFCFPMLLLALTCDNTTLPFKQETPTSTQTLHLLLVSDTSDPYIGESCTANAKRMNTVANEVAQQTGLQLQVHELKGGLLKGAIIPQWFAEIQPDSNDIVWFYYSGHGINRRPESNWPSLLAGKGGAVFLPKLHEQLVAKGAKLTITTADCCNIATGSFGKLSTIAMAAIIRREQSSSTLDSTQVAKRYQELFLNQQGDILASGCLKGQQSYASPLLGGFYTLGLAESLYSITHRSNLKPAWVTLLEEARQLTQETAETENRIQVPQFQTRLKPIVNRFRKGESVISLD